MLELQNQHLSMRSLCILFLSNLYPPHDLGGMEIRCHETVLRLQERGHQCHVLTSRFGADDVGGQEADVTRALHLQADIHHYRPLDFFVRRPGQERANGEAVSRLIESFQPDVVFVWGLWNLSLRTAYWAEQLLPGRVAYSVAGYWFMQPDAHEDYWQREARRPWVRRVMAPARRRALRLLAEEKAGYPLALEHVTCVSEFVRDKLSRAGALPHGARVIYNGIDAEPFLKAATQRKSDAGNGLRLVYTGGLVEHKGVHTAIEALGQLRRQGRIEGVKLQVVGGGHPDYEAQLRARAQGLGLRGYVTFRERAPRSEMPGILAGHDVFLFTSTYDEPIARSVMEAMAAGLAVVGTAVGGQGEMLEDGVNALVFPPGDAGCLAERILKLRGDPGARARLAAAGRRTVLQRFTLERMVDEMEAWLAEISG